MTFNEQVETVLKWYDETDIEEKEIFKNTPKQSLIRFHHSLGRNIRNKLKLWEVKWEPELRNGVDYSENHPDAISMRIIEAVWEKVQ